MTKDPLGRQGSAHLMGGMMLILAVLGAGYLYSSYKENKLSSDLPKVMAAYESMLDDAIKDPDDRAKLKQALGTLAQLIYKYNPSNLNVKTIEAIENKRLQLQGKKSRSETYN